MFFKIKTQTRSRIIVPRPHLMESHTGLLPLLLGSTAIPALTKNTHTQRGRSQCSDFFDGPLRKCSSRLCNGGVFTIEEKQNSMVRANRVGSCYHIAGIVQKFVTSCSPEKNPSLLWYGDYFNPYQPSCACCEHKHLQCVCPSATPPPNPVLSKPGSCSINRTITDLLSESYNFILKYGCWHKVFRHPQVSHVQKYGKTTNLFCMPNTLYGTKFQLRADKLYASSFFVFVREKITLVLLNVRDQIWHLFL